MTDAEMGAPPAAQSAARDASPSDDQPASKRVKLERDEAPAAASLPAQPSERRRGVAPIKAEFIVDPSAAAKAAVDDDAAEGSIATDDPANGKPDPRGDSRGEGRGGKKDKARKKQGGQNQNRSYGHFEDKIRLCATRTFTNEFSPRECKFGDRCNMCHDLRKYMAEGRRDDLDTFDGQCPIFLKYGRCAAGWKCRFVKSHSKEVEHDDGRKELVLLYNNDNKDDSNKDDSNGGSGGSGGEPKDDPAADADKRPGIVNVVSSDAKWDLARKKTHLARSEAFTKWQEKDTELTKKLYNMKKTEDEGADAAELADLRAQFTDPPFKSSEKRKLYFGRETPALAPLTTQGNLPFRRLCAELGAQCTYSEMAMGMPLVQGLKGEWALMKAHEEELAAPRYTPSAAPGSSSVVRGYDNARDLKFGVQISGNQPWVAMKATEALTMNVPHLRLVDLNCGCPIDLVFQAGAGSALLDAPPKLEKIIRGMNAVSGDVPITAKIRTGVRDDKPTATKIIERLAHGGPDTRERLGAPGCAAITLHGRSRQQRYTKSANWSYIAECAALIKSYNEGRDALADTAREPEENTQANGDRLYFLGNGDCYSHVDYFNHIDNAKVDSVMIGRGAMIKPWLFEEIEKGQYLDKSATERLGYIEKFVRYGLEAWGSDELGVGYTRRFLLEWLSFTHRYIPVGILEHLPPSLNDRPPKYRGRNELETLLASDNYKDWMKISEMFLGPAHPNFNFQPKHKSNSYEIEAEG